MKNQTKNTEMRFLIIAIDFSLIKQKQYEAHVRCCATYYIAVLTNSQDYRLTSHHNM